jgi:hypothetical protein
MEIRLSSPDLYFDQRIEGVASRAGCYARVKWATPVQVRFILVERALSKTPASFSQHDSVIRRLLELDPQATIRTAIAVYNGLDDFENQKSGALS